MRVGISPTEGYIPEGYLGLFGGLGFDLQTHVFTISSEFHMTI
jgi:hypothetical protein